MKNFCNIKKECTAKGIKEIVDCAFFEEHIVEDEEFNSPAYACNFHFTPGHREEEELPVCECDEAHEEFVEDLKKTSDESVRYKFKFLRRSDPRYNSAQFENNEQILNEHGREGWAIKDVEYYTHQPSPDDTPTKCVFYTLAKKI